MENDITKKIASLEENKDVAGLEEVKNDAEASFDGETVGLAEKAIARLNTKVEEITPPVETTESQKTQIENMGGSEEKLNEVVAPIDEKITEKDAEIKNVEVETEQKIREVKNETEEKVNAETNETITPKENSEKEITKEEFSKKFDNQLRSLTDTEERFKRKLTLQEQFYGEIMAEYGKFKEAGYDKGLKGVPFEHDQKYFDRELNSKREMINLLHRGLTEVNKVRQEISKRIENFEKDKEKGDMNDYVYNAFLDKYHNL